jgi:hypothetical protein
LAIREGFFLPLSAAMILLLAGCGGGASSVSNPPGPPSSSASVAVVFQPPPTGSVFINATTTLTAVVNNDSSNSGVDWALLCPPNANGNCGGLSPLHTDSGKATTYTAPQSLPINSQTFTIEAFATVDHSKNLVTSITVSAFASSLKGTYVFQANGVDAGGLFKMAGVIVMDGNGNITSGEETYAHILSTTGLPQSATDKISGGTYSIGPDGRGTMTLNTGDTNIGQTDQSGAPTGIENLSLVVLSSSQAIIASQDSFSDSSLGLSGESYQGTLELQTSTAPPTGGYAFTVWGMDTGQLPMAFGGILNIDSPTKISGAGSLADQDDFGTVTSCPNPGGVSGSVSSPDSFGAVTFTLTPCFAFSGPVQLTGYIVDATHIKLVESDGNGSGVAFGATAGVAIGQGAATGTFTTNGSFSGNYVFGVLGQNLSNFFAATTLSSAGTFTADGNGNLTNGYGDEFFPGVVLLTNQLQISDSFTGTYSADPSGTGRVDSTITFTHHSRNPGTEFIFYLTGNGNPPLILDADNYVSQGIPQTLAVGAGVAYPQAALPFSFNGKYGLGLTTYGAGEADGTGQITADGTADTLSGVMDGTALGGPNPGTPLAGSFNTTSTGRSSGRLGVVPFVGINNSKGKAAVAYYSIDSGHLLYVETDGGSVNSGGYMSLGIFSVRTPVCPACP